MPPMSANEIYERIAMETVRTGGEPVPRGVPAHEEPVGRRPALTEAADLHGHAMREGAAELIDDHAGAAVDVRGVLPGEEERFHAS